MSYPRLDFENEKKEVFSLLKISAGIILPILKYLDPFSRKINHLIGERLEPVCRSVL
jgi:hypothetical protein